MVHAAMGISINLFDIIDLFQISWKKLTPCAQRVVDMDSSTGLPSAVSFGCGMRLVASLQKGGRCYPSLHCRPRLPRT